MHSDLFHYQIQFMDFDTIRNICKSTKMYNKFCTEDRNKIIVNNKYIDKLLNLVYQDNKQLVVMIDENLYFTINNENITEFTRNKRMKIEEFITKKTGIGIDNLSQKITLTPYEKMNFDMMSKTLSGKREYFAELISSYGYNIVYQQNGKSEFSHDGLSWIKPSVSELREFLTIILSTPSYKVYIS